jgi:group II intron reverse transcriptase/maturase
MNWLSRILDPENLRRAWEEVLAKKGAAGLDRVSVKRWARNWEERLDALAMEVRANTYRARALKQFHIPKKDGTPRTISILTVTDRVIQRAVLRVVDDIFDRDFMECSYGYRPGRGVRDAVPAIIAHREAGRQWVLDADIDNCFPSLKHYLILRYFQAKVDHPLVTGLIKQWLAQGQSAPGVGISLGAVISPLLCNILLHQLDERLIEAGYAPVRYADDFCVFCETRAQAEKAMKRTAFILKKLHLVLEPNKTRIRHFDEGFDFLGVHFERDTYSFEAEEKRVEVKGAFNPELFHDYVAPQGYA